ncbi:putative F-box/LRR-repeat protein 9 [Triticum aestivum]|uniref:putative F-box/LRR-repeat protein 9 n=1 Tax=Triticum aestivum TaxID=4565 RepID=UPI001D00374B|nr:putative F-box/LRR-repeat protein 9 [Triticum aestivum]
MAGETSIPKPMLLPLLLDRSSMGEDDAAPPVSEPPARDWSLLPLDTLSSIFVRVGAVDVLMGAGLVCRSWLEAAKLPDVWRAVVMENHDVVFLKDELVLCAMAKAAVDRSDGQLRVFAGNQFVNNVLLKYILERSPSLATLRLVSCVEVFSTRLINVIRDAPLLELRSLELDDTFITVGELTAVLESCPLLEVLRVHNCFEVYDEDEQVLRAKFARIKTMTLGCDDEFRYGSDYESYDSHHVPDFEDERTDWSL